MKRNMKAMIAAMMCVPFSLLGLNCSAEETVKNWDYYAAMDDYAVYCEYCQVNGFEAAEALPDRKDLPNYSVYCYRGCPVLGFYEFYLGDEKIFTEEEERSHREDASYYGFPKDWIARHDAVLRVDSYNGNFAVFSFRPEAAETADIYTNFVNAYRIELTLLNSEFAKEYADQDKCVSPIVPDGKLNQLGDVDFSGTVDVMDVILVSKALLGDIELTEEQIMTADVNQNGKVDTADSLMILKEALEITKDFEEK